MSKNTKYKKNERRRRALDRILDLRKGTSTIGQTGYISHMIKRTDQEMAVLQNRLKFAPTKFVPWHDIEGEK